MIRNVFLLALLSSTVALSVVIGCSGNDDDNANPTPDTQDGERVNGLTKTQAAEVLVKVGDTTITVGEFAERLADQSPYLRARYNSPERRREFLDNMIRFELLALEAKRRGLDDLPEVQRTRKQVMIQQMMKELFEDRIQLADITDDEIRAYYEAHISEFEKPEQVRASHILIKDRGKAQRVLTQLLAKQSDVNLFRQMAEDNNEDAATRDRFGDLHFFSRPGLAGEGEPDVPAPVAEAAFNIEQIGGLYPRLVQTDEGYHIVKLTGRRAPLHRTLEEARRPIQNRLWRDKREKAVDDFVEQLRREATVEEHLDLLSEVHIELPEGASPTSEVPEREPSPGQTNVPTHETHEDEHH